MRSFLTVTLLFLVTSLSFGQRLQLRLVGSAYMWERQDTVGQASQHLFGHQTMQLSLAGENLSFHTYAQGFNDFAGPVKNDPQYRLYNLYVKWSKLFDVADISVGRQSIFGGVGNGTMDGGALTLRSNFFDTNVKLLTYYGALPPARQRAEMTGDQKNNFMMGSQLVLAANDLVQFSLSYMRKNIRPESYSAIRRDSLFNPYIVEITPTAMAEKYLSGDVNVEYEFVSAYGRYDYDMYLERTSRMQFFTRVKLMESLGLTGEYIYREPRLSFNSIFSVFTFNTLKEYEAGVEYRITPAWQVFGRYGSVNYGDDDSQRFTLGANGRYVSFSMTRDVGYDSELSAASANIGYPFPKYHLTPTFLVSYAKYKLSESASKLDDALSAAVGVVYRPMPVLSLDTQVQWVSNKIYKNDMRLFVRFSYLLSHRLDIF
jgi:hypothetical protein